MHQPSEQKEHLSAWRPSISAVMAVNFSIPLVIGGLIAASELGDIRVLLCGVAAIGIFAGTKIPKCSDTWSTVLKGDVSRSKAP